MNKVIKRIVLSVVLLALLGFLGYQYALTAGSRNLESEAAAFELMSKTWKQEFISNPDVATKKYINKAVEVTGIVAAIDQNVLTLEDGISCQFTAVGSIKKGDKIKIKGRVTGYDDLLEEVKMDQCLVPTNN